MDYGNPEEKTTVERSTMDYAKSAAQIRNGPGDLPLVTLILAELLESLVPETTPETTEDVTLKSNDSALPGENPVIPPTVTS